MEQTMKSRNENQNSLDLETPAKPQGPVECLGMTFDSEEARREHFLGRLREGLEELRAKLGGVPFATVEEAVERMKSVAKWPMGDDARLRELAECMRRADSSKDLLQRWKDEVGFPHGSIEDILNLCYDGKGEVPSQIHRYLSSNFKELRGLPKGDERLRAKAKDRWYVPDPNKASDLEKLRERALLRYPSLRSAKIRRFRREAGKTSCLSAGRPAAAIGRRRSPS